MQEFCLPVGQDLVNKDEKQYKNKENHKYTDTEDEEEKLMSHLYIGKKMVVNLFSKDQDQEGQYQGYGQEHGIKSRNHAEMKIVSGLFDAVDFIYAVCDGKDGTAGSPENEQNRDGHDRDRRPCVNLLHDLHDHIRCHAGSQGLQDTEHIIVGERCILNDRKDKNCKRESGENNIIGCLRRVGTHMVTIHFLNKAGDDPFDFIHKKLSISSGFLIK